MTAVDFKNIRSSPKSSNDSFEALSVQLFRFACSVPDGSTFVSLRGEGGDGGVEAYFRAPDGAVLGVQAKYFFKLDSGEIRQIDDSLQTALKNHPTLAEYWVYIPFDLTGRVAAGKRGKSQAERFEEWKLKVEAEAKTELRIILCTAAVIQGQLLKLDPNGGMRRYWFDESVLTHEQIHNCLDEAKAFAGPRYTASLDFVTSAHIGLDFFGGIGNFEAWRAESLTPVLTEIRSLKRCGDKALNILGDEDSAKARNLIDLVLAECKEIKDCFLSTSEIDAICSNVTTLLPFLIRVREAQEQVFYEKYGQERDTPGFRQFYAEYNCEFPAEELDSARRLEQLTLKLKYALTSEEVSAATTHSLLLVGPAGVGKTHAIVSAALRRLACGGLSLVVFGDDFGKAEPWEVIRSKLGFGSNISRTALFECLQACAEHTELPFVIYIDALNESPREARWKNKLPEFLVQCKPFSNIKVCVSTRDTYRDLVVESRFPGFAFEHVGFAGKEFEAVQAFAAHYGLDTEITPLFSPELSNPLFLHLACRTLKNEGRTTLDVSLPGFVALLEGHLKYCDDLVREQLQYSNPRNLVRASMVCLAEILTQAHPNKRTWEDCSAALKGLVGTEISPETMLKELQHVGLVILSSGEADTWQVRLGYQRYGDVLCATSLVESVIKGSNIKIPELAAKLSAIATEDEGILEALAVVLPEKTGIEITDTELGLDPSFSHRIFISGLTWRSRDSISHHIYRHLENTFSTPQLWQQVYDVSFRLSIVPDHRLNSENWLIPFLQRTPMVERDAYLSVAAFKSFDAKGAVWSLINSALHADIQRWPKESRQLAAFALAWLTSCADRRVRDLSAKGLTRVLASQPDVGPRLVQVFLECDDDYILESISLAAYSACLLESDRKQEFLPTLESLLDATFDSPNVLIRDSIRLLGRIMQDTDLPAALKKRIDMYPSKVPLPTSWPVLNDAKPLLDLEGLTSNMKLWGDRIGTDFWRYKVERRISDFDLESSNIGYENIACWFMTKVLQLGYPGYNECALDTDRALASEFGTGRGRKGYAERLGKKYYWVLLHRLIGILSDNVTPKKDSFSGWKPGPEHLWSVGVRKVDLTDIRDISPTQNYPDDILLGPKYTFPEHTSDIEEWVLSDDFSSHGQCIVRTSQGGDDWVALTLNAKEDDRSADDVLWDEPHLSVSFFYNSVFADGSIKAYRYGADEWDVFDSQGASCYRGFFAEYPDGSVFDQLAEEGYFEKGSNGIELSEVSLLRGGEWEYDYSHMTPERSENLSVPCQHVVKFLDLKWDRQRGWIDSNGELIAFEAKNKQRDGLFIRRNSLNKYLLSTGRQLVYRRFANRGFHSFNGTDNSQIDLFTWLQYQPESEPQIINQQLQPFNCGEAPTLVKRAMNKKFPFN